MRKTFPIIVIFIVSFVGLKTFVYGQTSKINSFNASPESVVSESHVDFSWSGEGIDKYKLYISCSSVVEATNEDGTDLCNQDIPMGQKTSARVKFTYNSIGSVSINVKLRGYQLNNGEEREVSYYGIIVKLNSANNEDNKGYIVAQIDDLHTQEEEVSTGYNDGKSTALITALFEGSNVDKYEIELDCPLPTTLDGVEERIDMIESGSGGVISPSKEGENCNVTQPASSSVNSFSFLLINNFETEQSVTLTLRAYNWKNNEYVLGDTKTEEIAVLPGNF